jgi:hypothetical protein
MCVASELRISLGVQGATGSIITVIGLTTEKPCRLIGKLRLVLKSDYGKRLRIRGNPGETTIDRLLAAGATASVAWSWLNWCGDRAYTVVAIAAGLRASSEEITPPRCDAPLRPSTLRLLHG